MYINNLPQCLERIRGQLVLTLIVFEREGTEAFVRLSKGSWSRKEQESGVQWLRLTCVLTAGHA